MSVENNIYPSLADRLINGEFAPGQRIRSQELRHDYNVAASTIREILFRLSSVGLVDFLEQRGFRMPEYSESLQHDLTHMRILLECEGACLSVRNTSVAWEARLTAAHHELMHIETRIRESDDVTSLVPLWCAAELRFHSTLIEECHSTLLVDYHRSVFQRFRQQLVASGKQFVFIDDNVREHQAILDAVLEYDESALQEHIRSHLARNLDSARL